MYNEAVFLGHGRLETPQGIQEYYAVPERSLSSW